MSRKEDQEWSFGLINSANKYLTAETFGAKIVCASNTMKKKQIFFMEQGDGVVAFRSHLGKYLTVDPDGKFLGNAESNGESEKFVVEPQKDGRWALKSQKYGWYAGGTGENLSAFTTEVTEEKLWTVHLAMHPMVTIQSVFRKAYVHLSDDGTNLSTDEIIPWGHDAVLSLKFVEGKGCYTLVASNGKCMASDGTLCDHEDKCNFTLEINGHILSLFSVSSKKYFTSLGSTGIMKASKSSAGKDEHFTLHNSYPQVTLKSHNGKFISIKQGVELAASAATDGTDLEIFQLEPLSNGNWTVKGSTDKLWSEVNGAAHCVKDPIPGSQDNVDAAEKFEIEFLGSHIAIKSTTSSKYLSQANNGYVKFTAATADEENKSLFEFKIVNRRALVLRGEFGFIGTLPSGLLEANKSMSEEYTLEMDNGKVAIRSSSKKYFKVGENGISATSETPEFYTVELFGNSKMAIKTESGNYFQCSQNGALTATGTSANTTYTLFEY